MTSLEQLEAALPCGRLTLTDVAGVRLWLLADDVPRGPLSAEQFRAAWDEPPFWAFAWPAGRWLAETLPAELSAQTVIDLGCGSGLLSVALARAGVAVVAVDRDPLARLATACNAAENEVDFPILAELDEAPDADLLLLADFLYDPANLSGLEPLCRRARRTLLADCRLQLCPPGFRALPAVKSSIVPDLDWNDEFSRVFRAVRP